MSGGAGRETRLLDARATLGPPCAPMPPPRSLCCLFASALAGCADPALPGCPGELPAPLSVQVVDHGWHTDLALPADGLTGGIGVFRRIFPRPARAARGLRQAHLHDLAPRVARPTTW